MLILFIPNNLNNFFNTQYNYFSTFKLPKTFKKILNNSNINKNTIYTIVLLIYNNLNNS